MRTRRVVIPSAIGALVAAAGLAQGQDRHWVGGTDLSWNNPLNWSPQDVPNTFAENAILDASGAYQVLLSGGISLGSLTLAQSLGRLGLTPGASLALGGNVANASEIFVNTSGAASDTTVQLVANATFSGSNGALVLNAHPSNWNTGRVVPYAGGEVLTNAAGHVILGNGLISVGLDNQGIVVADRPGMALAITGNAKSNSGTMRAVDGGVLQLLAGITNVSGGSIRADGGSVEVYAVGVAGGQVSGMNAGRVLCVGNNTTFTGVDTAGAVDIVAGHGLNIAASFTNTGTITVNPDGAASDTWIIATGSFTVGGDGQMVLNAHPSNYNTGAIGWYAGPEVITNGASHTIRGAGRIAPTIVNEGTILADQNGRSLYLTNNTKTNNNVIRALNGGNLEVMSSVTQGASGRLVADDGARVNLYDMTLTAGRVQAFNGGLAQALGNATLVNVAVEGPMTQAPGHTLYTAGTLSIADTLTMNPEGVAGDTWLSAVGDLTLAGGGTVVLNAHPSNYNTACITRYTGAETVTNSAGNTIRGAGRIYAALVNNGVVHADQGRLLYCDGGTKTNTNLFTATNGSTLQFASPVTQAGGGLIVADGATVSFGAMTLTSGVARAVNSGLLMTVGSPTFVNVSVEGPMHVLPAQSWYVAGGLHNAGTITLNPAGAASDTWLVPLSNISLAGAGEIVLNAHPSNLNTAGILYYAGNEVITNTSTHSIRGTGRILAQMVNDGVIAADQPGKSLLINARPVANAGIIRAVDGALLDLATTITGPGDIIGADSAVRFFGGTISGQHIASTGTGLVGVHAHTMFGDVTIEGRVDVQPGVSMQIGGSGITNNAAIRVNPAGAATDTNMAIFASVRLGGSGQLLLNAHPSNFNTGCVAWYAGNEVLTNGATHTIAGSGMIDPTLVNEGILSPGTGDGPGALLGSTPGWTLTGTSVVGIDLFGATSFDRLFTTGPIAIAGDLHLGRGLGYVGRQGDSYVIIQGASITGRFAHIPPRVRVTYTPTQVILLDACQADLDDGTMTGMPDAGVDISDLLYFIAQYEQGTLGADLDDGSMTGTPDQGVTIDDLLYFLARYEAGC